MTPDEIDHSVIGFGKYREYTPDEVATFDPGYVVWMREAIKDRGMVVSDVLYKECIGLPKPAFKIIPQPGFRQRALQRQAKPTTPYHDDDIPF